jgi:transcriptional regulator with XRE-family HTH domain
MGMTLKQVADVSGYSIPTINALELEGRGSERLVEKLTAIYGNRLDVDFAKLQELPPESEAELWKRRAKNAEKELHELKQKLGAMLSPASSTVNLEAEKDRIRERVLGRPGQKSAAE